MAKRFNPYMLMPIVLNVLVLGAVPRLFEAEGFGRAFFIFLIPHQTGQAPIQGARTVFGAEKGPLTFRSAGSLYFCPVVYFSDRESDVDEADRRKRQ